MGSLLFIAPEDAGEAVLSTAALDAALATSDRVVVACTRAAAPLFRAVPGLMRTIELSGGRWAKALALMQGGADQKFDLALDLSGERLAYAVRARRRLMRGDARVLRHRLEDYAALMNHERLRPRLWLDDRARADAARVGDDAPVLALAPAATTQGEVWSAERFAAVARRLASGAGPLAGARVVVLGSAADAEAARFIVASLDADGVRAANLAGQLDLLAAGALLARATLFVATESAWVHVGAAAGAPTLALFGARDERVVGPYGPRARVLRGRPFAELMAARGLDASAALEDVSVDAVEAAALDLLRAGGL